MTFDICIASSLSKFKSVFADDAATTLLQLLIVTDTTQ